MAFTRKATHKTKRRKRRKSAPPPATPRRKRRKTRSDKGKRRVARRKTRSDKGKKRGTRRSKASGVGAYYHSGAQSYASRSYSTPPTYSYPRYKPKRRRKSNIVLSENPIHFPRTMRGRPSKTSYWLLDVYSGNYVTTYIGRSDKTTAQRDAMRKLIKSGADRVALSGPYRTKPHLQSVRK